MNKKGLEMKKLVTYLIILAVAGIIFVAVLPRIRDAGNSADEFSCNLKGGSITMKMSCVQYRSEHDCPGDHSRYPRDDDVIAGVMLDKEKVKDINPDITEWKIDADNPYGIEVSGSPVNLNNVPTNNRENIANNCRDKYYCYKNMPKGHECYPINPLKENICGIKYISGGSMEAQVRYNVQHSTGSSSSYPKGMPLEWMTTVQECIASREDCAEAAKKLC